MIKSTLISVIFLVLAACSGEQPGVDINASLTGSSNADGLTGIEQEYDPSEIELGRSLYEAQCQSCHGTKDKAGPYGGYFLDGSSLASGEALVEYVANLMPISQPHACGQECSEAILAYAATEFLNTNEDTVTDPDDGTDTGQDNGTDTGPDSGTNTGPDNGTDTGTDSGTDTGTDAESIAKGLQFYDAQCAACHGQEGEGGAFSEFFVANSAINTDQLMVTYIANNMPLGDEAQCDEDCSKNILDYAKANFQNYFGETDTGTDTGSNIKAAELLMPVANTVISTASITIKPSHTQLNLWLDVGTTKGGENLFNASISGDQIVTNIPLNGQNIYITLWSEIDGTWGKLEYEFKTADAGEGVEVIEEAPNAPSSLVASLAASNEMINVFWNDNSSDEQGFSVQRKVDSGTWSSIAVTAQNINIYVDSSIEEGKSYQYRVRSYKAALNSAYTSSAVINVIKTQVETLPQAPSQLTAQLDNGVMNISWADNSDNESGFVLSRRIQNGSWEQLAVLAMNVTNYQNLSLLADTTYEYRVNAFNEKGDSAIVSVTAEKIPADETEAECAEPQYVAGTAYVSGQKVLNDGGIYQCKVAGWCSSNSALHYEPKNGINWPDAWTFVSNASCEGGENQATAPSAVSNVNGVVNAFMASINISWTDAADETGYSIQRKQNTDAWMALTELAANNTVFTDTNVQAGNDYQYRIAAFNAVGESAWVSTSSINLAAEQTIPTVVSTVSAVLSNDKGNINLTWNDQSNNETGFKIERKKDSGSWTLQSSKAANSTSYNDGLITEGSSYQYRVAPFNEAGTATYVQSTIITIEATNNSGGADQLAFENNCTGCHTASGGIGGNLLDGFVSSKWEDKSYDQLLDKVHTMNTPSCDDACQALAADYLWLNAWGLEKEIIVVANGRGVRGVRLLTPKEYQKSVFEITGVQISEDELPGDYFDTEFKYPTQADTGVVLYDGVKKYLSLAESVSENVSLTTLGCSSSTCTSAQIDTLGYKMHRRPLTASEKSDYVNLNNSDGSRAMLTSMLLSPNFLYKKELGEWNATEAAYELNDYELASALAFMIWGSTPDLDLLNIAKNGGLSTDAQVTSVVSDMMNDARFATNMSHFIKYYTHSYQQATEKPGLNTSVINAMYDEQSAFVDYWLNQDDASFYKLLNPGYTFVDATLASHYGLNVSTSSLHKVNTDRSRGGLLHQGLTQIMNSDFAATSLVKRGKMIRENMMCHKMGVPSGVDPSTIELPSTPLTTRERWNAITGPNASEGQCWECHQLMNEQGASLEQFDAAGRYRTSEQDYNGSTTQLILDVTGTLRDNSSDPLMQFSDARELTEYLGSSNLAKSCFAESFVRYATGHESDGYNKEELEGLEAKFNQNDNVRSMITWIAQSAMMRYRVAR